MAQVLTRAAAGNIMWFLVFVGLDSCHISSSGSHRMGLLVNCDIGSRYNWFGSYHGWDSSSFGVLFNNAVVENTMAKLKYAFF